MGQATIKASARRLREARRRGMVPVSRELMSVAALAGVVVVVATAWPHMLGRLRHDLGAWISLSATGVPAWAALSTALQALVAVAGPVLGAALLCALATGLIQTRGMVSLHPLRPSLGRLIPGSGGPGGSGYALLSDGVRGLGVVALGTLTLWQHGGRFLETAGQPPLVALGAVAICLLDLVSRIGLLLLVLAALDVVHARWAHGRRLRMTRREVLMERRESEGDPHHRARRRRLHQEMMTGFDLESVGQAHCVVSGRSVAAALRYDERSMSAPRVLVSGAQRAAAAIRAEARVHGCPVVHNGPLARALALVEPGTEVPHRLWRETADVLKEARSGS